MVFLQCVDFGEDFRTVGCDVGTVEDWYCSRFTYLFSLDKSTHIWMLSVSFFGATTMGARHSVCSVTGVMIPCFWSRSSSALNFARYAYGTDRGVCTQNSLALSDNTMWNFSPCIVLMWPSKTVRYSCTISLGVGMVVADLIDGVLIGWG